MRASFRYQSYDATKRPAMPESTLCRLHQEALVSKPAEILYGVYDVARDVEDARANLFPN
ncbi:MAG: hypothetical protein ACI9ZF_003056 [Bradyrhizobium sp.]|jgi:hypothetical protein